ncbi:hypothetical protein HRbin36_01150 [bacterium HR36]|nr:hypothetical protein HRbin36_01150 [bacterium HR36]
MSSGSETTGNLLQSGSLVMDVALMQKSFEEVMQHMRALAEHMRQHAAAVVQEGAFRKARRILKLCERIDGLTKEIVRLQRQWNGLTTKRRRLASGEGESERLEAGLQTPGKVFHEAIFETLFELGGSAPTRQVLELLEAKMAGRLNEYDRQPIPSNPKVPRWRSRVGLFRAQLVKKGLLAADSSRGIWQLTESGRRYIEQKRSTPETSVADASPADSPPANPSPP